MNHVLAGLALFTLVFVFAVMPSLQEAIPTSGAELYVAIGVLLLGLVASLATVMKLSPSGGEGFGCLVGLYWWLSVAGVGYVASVLGLSPWLQNWSRICAPLIVPVAALLLVTLIRTFKT